MFLTSLLSQAEDNIRLLEITVQMLGAVQVRREKERE
jgi:hypothetical protein